MLLLACPMDIRIQPTFRSLDHLIGRTRSLDFSITRSFGRLIATFGYRKHSNAASGNDLHYFKTESGYPKLCKTDLCFEQYDFRGAFMFDPGIPTMS